MLLPKWHIEQKGYTIIENFKRSDLTVKDLFVRLSLGARQWSLQPGHTISLFLQGNLAASILPEVANRVQRKLDSLPLEWKLRIRLY